jgi:hypothetical protein
VIRPTDEPDRRHDGQVPCTHPAPTHTAPRGREGTTHLNPTLEPRLECYGADSARTVEFILRDQLPRLVVRTQTVYPVSGAPTAARVLQWFADSRWCPPAESRRHDWLHLGDTASRVEPRELQLGGLILGAPVGQDDGHGGARRSAGVAWHGVRHPRPTPRRAPGLRSWSARAAPHGPWAAGSFGKPPPGTRASFAHQLVKVLPVDARTKVFRDAALAALADR